MKAKLLNILLIITPLIGYLKQPGNAEGGHLFLFQMEGAIFSKIVAGTPSIDSPFIFLPFAGQLIFLFTLFQKQASRVLTYIGIASIGILMVFIFFIGILFLIKFGDFKTLLSTLPFLITAIVTIRHHRKLKKIEK